MDTNRTNEYALWHAAVHGYNADMTFWKTLTGLPTIASSKLRLNSASSVSLAAFLECQVRITLNTPVAPTSGQDKFWGLSPLPGANNGKIGFLTSGATFKAIAYDNAGNAIIDQTITWDATWHAADTVWEITSNRSGIFLAVNGVVIAKGDVAGYSVRGTTNYRAPSFPGFVHIVNGNADNMDVSSVIIMGVAHTSSLDGLSSEKRSDSSGSSATITPHDSTNLSALTRGIFVGTGGLNITAVMEDGTVQLFTNVPNGVFPIRCTRVNATGTTATNLVALF